jgi:hypothetical protein
MLHLNRVSSHSSETGMTAKNLSIVWAPNLIRSACTEPPTTPPTDGSSELQLQQARAKLQMNLVHNTQIIQYLIDNAKWMFEGDSDNGDEGDGEDEVEEEEEEKEEEKGVEKAERKTRGGGGGIDANVYACCVEIALLLS